MSEKLNFNFNKSMKEKEAKIMNYYRKNMSKELVIVPKPFKKRKLTQKQNSKMPEKQKEHLEEKEEKEDNKLTSINKTKKQIVIMDD